MIARMWEARAEPESFDALLRWVCQTAVPRIETLAGHSQSDIYKSADLRVVVISLWSGDPVDLPEAPPELVARPPHAWNFTPVERTGPV